MDHLDGEATEFGRVSVAAQRRFGINNYNPSPDVRAARMEEIQNYLSSLAISNENMIFGVAIGEQPRMPRPAFSTLP